METYFANMNAAEGSKEKLVQDLMTLVRDAESLVKTAGGNLADKSRQDLITALERVKASCRRLEAQAAVHARTADRVIRDHPYESIGVAFGIGLLLGILGARD
jgi:ElaB/YqjD/DUF883 family membrane-anchored ribosome-binding protein